MRNESARTRCDQRRCLSQRRGVQQNGCPAPSDEMWPRRDAHRREDANSVQWLPKEKIAEKMRCTQTTSVRSDVSQKQTVVPNNDAHSKSRFQNISKRKDICTRDLMAWTEFGGVVSWPLSLYWTSCRWMRS